MRYIRIRQGKKVIERNENGLFTNHHRRICWDHQGMKRRARHIVMPIGMLLRQEGLRRSPYNNSTRGGRAGMVEKKSQQVKPSPRIHAVTGQTAGRRKACRQAGASQALPAVAC